MRSPSPAPQALEPAMRSGRHKTLARIAPPTHPQRQKRPCARASRMLAAYTSSTASEPAMPSGRQNACSVHLWHSPTANRRMLVPDAKGCPPGASTFGKMLHALFLVLCWRLWDDHSSSLCGRGLNTVSNLPRPWYPCGAGLCCGVGFAIGRVWQASLQAGLLPKRARRGRVARPALWILDNRLRPAHALWPHCQA